METAVSLVEAYLRTNGYFTVTDYPILKPLPQGGYREATDLDILAFRFGAASSHPHAGPRQSVHSPLAMPDPALGSSQDAADMIIGEVKEGNAEINPRAWDRGVMRAALTRFGCCGPHDADRVVGDLLEGGRARTSLDHTIRIVAFGSWEGESRDRHPYTVVRLQHVVEFLRTYLRQHWDAFGSAHLQEPALDFLQLLEKAERGMHRRA